MKRLALALALGLTASLAWGAELTDAEYVVYAGDTNSDGRSDYYLHRRPQTVILSIPTIFPIAKPVSGSYVLLQQSDGTFAAPVADDELDHSGLTLVTTRLSFGDFNADTIGDLLIQGAASTDQTLLLTGSTAAPVLLAQFTAIDGEDVSAADGVLTLEDEDSDGFADLVFDPSSGPEVTYTNHATGAFSLDLPRTTSYSYTTAGLVHVIDGPRKDLTDTLTHTYDGNDELWKVTNALGHITEIVDRDARGYPVEVEDANGVVTELAYDLRGRLDTRTVKHPSTSSLDATTDYDYYANGLLKKLTLPDGTFVEFGYDTAQHLTSLENSFDGSGSTGERLEFTLDDAGNRTEERVKTNTGTLVQKLTREFDELSRVHKLKDNATTPNETEFDYDGVGNETAMTDALANVTEQLYDGLNRLTELEDADDETATFEYDDRDNLVEVTDPRGITTAYRYDAADNLIEEDSPDAGRTAYAYDLADNLTQTIDARGVVTNYAYDALNRLTGVQYPQAPEEDINYAYDDVSVDYSKGRLTEITDSVGSISYEYDHRGNVTLDARIVDGEAYDVAYTYTLADHVQTMTYPSAMTLTFVRDDAGRVRQIKHGATVLIDNVEYHPFGGAIAWDTGNGLTQTFTVDLDGRIAGRKVLDGTTELEDWAYDFDAVHNIEAIAKDAGTEAYGYDALYRLDEQTPIGQAQIAYTYDAVGNRTSETQSSTTKTHTYASTSNRQTGFDGEAIGYDDAGNRISDIDGARTYVYNAAGRLVEVKTGSSTIATYAYNALGQRVQKDDQVQETEFVYDLDGNLIGEYDDGTPIREYVYLNGVPVLQVEGGTKFYLHPDHLGTPRAATDASKDIVWTWGGEAFGSNLPEEDPDNDSTDTTVNLRFPGQYFDAETELHYNYFRDYEPLMGRYVQSDPIGLEGGLNIYGYVDGSPVVLYDPDGLRHRAVRELHWQEATRHGEVRAADRQRSNVERHLERIARQAAIVNGTWDKAADRLEDIISRHPILPMACVKWVCPWDDLSPRQTCPVQPVLEPPARPRGAGFGCHCEERLPVWRGGF